MIRRGYWCRTQQSDVVLEKEEKVKYVRNKMSNVKRNLRAEATYEISSFSAMSMSGDGQNMLFLG